METQSLTLAGVTVVARASGALWWPERALLAVADLHLGRATATARRGGSLLPPYETEHTLDRLEAEVLETGARRVVCVGDSFDDMKAAAETGGEVAERLSRMAAGRVWTWIAGNHDPGPLDLPGSHVGEATIGPLVFRHIAAKGAAAGEVSAHYHPKLRFTVRGQPVARPCFLTDGVRLILPAFGTFTGGLDIRDPAFDALLGPEAVALATGRRLTALPRRALA